MGMCDFQTKIKISKQTMAEIQQRFFDNNELSFKKIVPNTKHVFWEFEFTDDTMTYRSLSVATSIFKALSKKFPAEEIVIELSTRNVYASISSETQVFKAGKIINITSVPNPVRFEDDLEDVEEDQELKNPLLEDPFGEFCNEAQEELEKELEKE